MYCSYFGLAEKPFSIAPAPRYLYMSGLHREALAHLVYGLENDCGFVLLTGEVGTGKTTVCRCLLEQIPADTEIAYIVNPRLTVVELLASICEEFRLGLPADLTSQKVLVDRLNGYLLQVHAEGRKAVLIIDEAQNLGFDLLEQLRLLTNLETSERKLLQIILLGQPELREMLARPQCRQLAQRITARYHLQPLTRRETAVYIAHRLQVARQPQHTFYLDKSLKATSIPEAPESGVRGPELFPPAVIRTIHSLSGGIPRLINVLCDRALLGTYVEGKNQVTRAVLRRAAREVFGRVERRWQRPGEWMLLPALAAVFGLILLGTMGELPWRSVPAGRQIMAQPEQGQGRAVAAAESVPTADESDSLDWPENEILARSRFLAFQSLFSRWGVSYETAAEEPCRFARDQGLQCLEQRGSLELLRRLDRPAVLPLRDEQGNRYHATLLGLSKSSARLLVGAEPRLVPINRLGQGWSGQFTLFWKPSADYQAAAALGNRPASIHWLATELQTITGRAETGAESGTAPLSQEEAIRILKGFQAAVGLVPDGIPGPHTLIRFNSAVGRPAPRLSSEEKEN